MKLEQILESQTPSPLGWPKQEISPKGPGKNTSVNNIGFYNDQQHANW